MAANPDFRKAAEKAQENPEKMTSASGEALKDAYATTIKGAQDYTGKVPEFAQVNANSAIM